MDTDVGRANPWLSVTADGNGRGNIRILVHQKQ